MEIYLQVDIETQSGTFKRVNTQAFDVPLDGTLWKPRAGVLFYPDRRATRMRVFVASGSGIGDPASGIIIVSNGYTSNQIEAYTVSLDGEQITVAPTPDATTEEVATAIKDAINAQSNRYSARVGGTIVTITADSIGPDDNGPITVDTGTTGIVAGTTYLTGGTLLPDSSPSFDLIETIDLNPSMTGNYAFALVDKIDITGFEDTIDFSPQDYNNENHIVGNRVKVSEVNNPFLFEPEKTYYPGQDSGDRVIGFAVNALPISIGQFGQYPIYVLCESSIWALEQSPEPDVAFGHISPVSITHGLASGEGVINVGRTIIFVFNGRIYRLGNDPTPEDISEPIGKYLTGTETLAYYNHDDVSELWVSTDSKTYIYNMQYRRWYSIDRTYKYFMASGNNLIGVGGGNTLEDVYDLAASDVSISVDFAPIHYGYPDRYKRLYDLVIRGEFNINNFSITFERSAKTHQTNKHILRPRAPSDFSFTAHIDGLMTPGSPDYLHELYSEYDLRYPGRQRDKQTTPQL